MSLHSPLLLSALLIVTATGFTTNHHGIVSSTSYSTSSSALSMVAVDTSEIKNGLTIELDGEPYKVLNFSIMKQARGAAKTTIRMKNLKKGNTIENTYRSGEKFETAEILRKPSQYTYEDDVSVILLMTNCINQHQTQQQQQLQKCTSFIIPSKILKSYTLFPSQIIPTTPSS